MKKLNKLEDLIRDIRIAENALVLLEKNYPIITLNSMSTDKREWIEIPLPYSIPEEKLRLDLQNLVHEDKTKNELRLKKMLKE